jgi:hypothetical protein
MFWILTACTSAPVGGPKGVTAEPAGAQHLVRLTHLQWEHAVVALLHLPGESGWLPTLVPDPLVSRFDSDAEGLYVDPTLWMQYQAAAEGLGLRVISEPESYAAVVPAEDREVWLTSFAGRAFRRAPTQAEVDGLAVVFDDAAAEFPEETPFRAGVRAVVTAVLQSPAFLYRTEGVHSDDPARLGPEELASRVAFALWNGPPDDALLAAAAAGLPPEVLAAEVDRMLADPRARDTVAHLHRQLYHVDGYENIFRPSEEVLGIDVFEHSTPASMQREVLAYVDDVVFGGGTVADLLTRRTTFADERLGAIYGVEGGRGERLARVELPPERAGLLTLSGFLAWQADRVEPNLIGRGGFVNDVILCADIPPPPNSVPPLPPPAPGLSQRERVESHTTSCGGGCHAPRINPVGFALGGFDLEGRWAPQGIDAAASYSFEGGERAFDGAVELAHLLAEQPEVHRCYASHLLAYYEGRSLGAADLPRVHALALASLAGRPIRELLRDLVLDDAFGAVRQ